jgi:hypothetical protein
MINCERCGKPIPDTAAICPSCGAISPFARQVQTPPGNYEQPSNYNQGYNSPPNYAQPSGPGYSPQPGYAPPAGYGQVPYNPYPPVAVNVNVATPMTPVAPATNTGALVAEILLNIFVGIYGVGWLMAGETTTGVILLVCSIVLYWPVMIVGTILTLGIGLICLGPLAIGAIILNAILLNNTLKRKATLILIQPVQPIQTMPPQ